MDIKILKTQTDEIGRKYIEISPTARILFKDNDVYFVAITEKGFFEYRIDSLDKFCLLRLQDLYSGLSNNPESITQKN